MSGRLRGKIALITGAAQGIGLEIAKTFVNEGASVIATDKNGAKLDEVVADLDCGVCALDVTDADAVAKCAAEFHQVNVLVNCAGMVPVGTILDCSEHEWGTTLEVNVTSMYRTCRAFLPSMLRRGEGSIVNIASVVASSKAAIDRFAYGTSKGAVVALTKSIARDFINHGVRCNSISPGTVATPSYHQRIAGADDPAAALEVFLARQPMGRIGRVDEIAALAVLLASDEAQYMTGHDLIVDGGFSL